MALLASPPTPFTIAFAEAEITEMYRRLETARFAPQDIVPDRMEDSEGNGIWGMGLGE